MKYGVSIESYGTLTLHSGVSGEDQKPAVFLEFLNENEYNGGETWELTVPEFRDFRKAVGYVWQEVHSDAE